jgi:hypothetical protein
MGRQEIKREIITCDFCKREIEDENKIIELRLSSDRTEENMYVFDMCHRCASEMALYVEGDEPVSVVPTSQVKKKGGRPKKKVAKKVKKTTAKRKPKPERAAPATEETDEEAAPTVEPPSDVTKVVEEACAEAEIETPKKVTLRDILREARSVDPEDLKKSLQANNMKYFEPTVSDDGNLIWDGHLGCWRQNTDIAKRDIKKKMREQGERQRKELDRQLKGGEDGDYGKMNVKTEG